MQESDIYPLKKLIKEFDKHVKDVIKAKKRKDVKELEEHKAMLLHLQKKIDEFIK